MGYRAPVGVLAAYLCVCIVSSGNARAEVFTVNTFDDVNTGSCGDTECSLREAVIASGRNGENDTIELVPGTYELTIIGTGEDGALAGDLDILDDSGSTLSIEGGRIDEMATVSASGLGDRGLHVLPGAYLTLNGVTVTGGDGSWHGGGIYNEGHLLVFHSVVKANASSHWSGGGLYNLAVAQVQFSTVRDNACPGSGGGIFNGPDANLYVHWSTISGNSASHGGGIENQGQLQVNNSTISGNSAWSGGGGIGIDSPLPFSGQTEIEWSTVVENWSLFQGDAIDAVDVFAHTTTLSRSIVQGECWSPMASLGWNLESPGDTCSLDQLGDQPGIPDLLLAPLAGNGGPTRTHALLPGSPAINSTLCGAPFDQREAYRPTVLGCDKGAFELEAVPTGPWIFEDGFESGTTLAWSSAVP